MASDHVYDKMHSILTFQYTQECSINNIDNNNDLGDEFDTNISIGDHGDLPANESVND